MCVCVCVCVCVNIHHTIPELNLRKLDSLYECSLKNCETNKNKLKILKLLRILTDDLVNECFFLSFPYRWCAYSLSHVRLFVTPWTVALSRLFCLWEFSRQEYWMGSCSLLQGIIQTQGSDPRSPMLQADSLLSEPPQNKFALLYKSISRKTKTKNVICTLPIF